MGREEEGEEREGVRGHHLFHSVFFHGLLCAHEVPEPGVV